LGEEEDFLERLTPGSLTKGEELDVGELCQLPPALQRRVIRKWLAQHEVSEPGFEVVEKVRGLLAGGAPARINLARDRHARRRVGKIFLE